MPRVRRFEDDRITGINFQNRGLKTMTPSVPEFNILTSKVSANAEDIKRVLKLTIANFEYFIFLPFDLFSGCKPSVNFSEFSAHNIRLRY